MLPGIHYKRCYDIMPGQPIALCPFHETSSLIIWHCNFSVVGHLTYIMHIMRWLWHNRDFDWTIVQCVLERNLSFSQTYLGEDGVYTNTHFSTTEQSTKKQYLWKLNFPKRESGGYNDT